MLQLHVSDVMGSPGRKTTVGWFGYSAWVGPSVIRWTCGGTVTFVMVTT